MEATELRIGNYVMYGSEYRKVSGVDDNDERGSYVRFLGFHYGVWIEEVQPIPLTEDILIKCGFTKVPLDSNNPEEGYYYSLRLSDDKYCDLSLLSGDKNGIFEVYLFPYENIRFQYLHQVQNLFYCLCGEELVINIAKYYEKRTFKNSTRT